MVTTTTAAAAATCNKSLVGMADRNAIEERNLKCISHLAAVLKESETFY